MHKFIVFKLETTDRMCQNPFLYFNKVLISAFIRIPDDSQVKKKCKTVLQYEVSISSPELNQRLNKPKILRAIWTLGLNILWVVTKFWRQLAWGLVVIRPLLLPYNRDSHNIQYNWSKLTHQEQSFGNSRQVLATTLKGLSAIRKIFKSL